LRRDHARNGIGRSSNYTDAQQRDIEEIQRVAAELGVDRLSSQEFDRLHRVAGCTSAGYQFGSWNAAVKAAGLEPYPTGFSNVGPKLSDDELLLDLLRLEADLGTRPSELKVAAFGRYSPKPYKDRWNSIANAFETAKARFSHGG
jgi:Homing endonuclease associated repeat